MSINNGTGNGEIRLEIETDDSMSTTDSTNEQNNNNRSRILSIFSSNNQYILENVISGYQSFARLQQQQQSSTTSSQSSLQSQNNQAVAAAPAPNIEIPLQDPTNSQDQNEDFVLWLKVVKTIIRFIPILLILTLKFTVDHIQAIVAVLMLHSQTWYLDTKFKEEVAKKTQRSQVRLSGLLLFIFAPLFLERTWFIDESSSLGLFIIYSNNSYIDIPLSQLLYQVIITDCILKLISIFLKISINIAPMKMIHIKQRARSYAFIENFMQLYRCLAPIHIWSSYFFLTYEGWMMVFGGTLLTFYIIYKFFDIVKRVRTMRSSLSALFRNVNHGRIPTKSELDSSDQQCAICHDNFSHPVILCCSHIFCENCVTTWLTSERTCPLCRAKVADCPRWQCGSTSLFYQIY